MVDFLQQLKGKSKYREDPTDSRKTIFSWWIKKVEKKFVLCLNRIFHAGSLATKKQENKRHPMISIELRALTFWQGEDWLCMACTHTCGSVIEMGTEWNLPGSSVSLPKGLPDIISWFSSGVFLKCLAYLLFEPELSIAQQQAESRV